MKFLLMGIGSLFPDPHSGRPPTATERLDQVLRDAMLAEELGIDAFGVGERHAGAWAVTTPPVVLAAAAARTRRIRLMTTVAVLGMYDPVRFAEDYATVDQLSHGRLELIIGRGSEPRQYLVFGEAHLHRVHDVMREKYELLDRLWTQEWVDWDGEFRAPLRGVTTMPRPFQAPRPPIWHGGASSPETAELAAEHGNPFFTANAIGSAAGYARMVDLYRRRWAERGRDPAGAVVGAGSSALYVAPTSQEAMRRVRPYWDSVMRWVFRGAPSVPSLDEQVGPHGAALVGSPQQVAEKLLAWHELFGHSVQQLSLDVSSTMPAEEQRRTLERFMSEVAPVLRREAPTAVWEPATAARAA